jgi:hypothetical protein
MTSAQFHKPHLRLYPFEGTEDDDDLSVFTKYRSVGGDFPERRTMSASPRAPHFHSAFSSMPNLKQFADNCSLVDVDDMDPSEIFPGMNNSNNSNRNSCSGTDNVNRGGYMQNYEMQMTGTRAQTAKVPMPSPDSVAQEIFFVPPSSSLHVPISAEAPARLNSPTREVSQASFRRNMKPRANSIACGEMMGSFCNLESTREEIMKSDLPSLVQLADAGLKAGIDPVMADDAMGGCYFMRDKSRSIQLVFKPSDEEPNAPNNPQKGGSYGGAYRGRIVPGFGMYREVASYIIDKDNFAGVPPTEICKVRSPVLYDVNKVGPYGYKIGSIQSYVRSECSAEEMGSAKFDEGDVMRMAALDIRICNLDRHAGNILVSRSAPYQHPRVYIEKNAGSKPNSAPASLEIGKGFHMPKSPEQSPCSPPVSPLSSKYRLVPIDHGFSFPHVLNLSDATFAWLTWPQAKEPIPTDVQQYIQNLNAEEDCAKIRKFVGAAIPETSLLSLKICTKLLQYGVGKGLSLYDIGMCMTTHDDIPFNMSRLQQCVNQAIIAVLLNELSEKTKKKCISSGRSRSPILPADHTVNDHNLGAALKVNDGITLLDEIFQSVERVVDTYKSDCHF